MARLLIPLGLLLSACTLTVTAKELVNITTFTEDFTKTRLFLIDSESKANILLRNIRESRKILRRLRAYGLHTAFLYNAIPEVREVHCPKGWHLHKSTCYRAFKSHVPWPQAQINCQRFKGTLALADNRNEDIFIGGLLSMYAVKQFEAGVWVGASDVSKEGRWWSYATNKTVSYVRWAPGEPSNRAQEDCMYLTPRSFYRSHDGACMARKAYACQQKMD